MVRNAQARRCTARYAVGMKRILTYGVLAMMAGGLGAFSACSRASKSNPSGAIARPVAPEKQSPASAPPIATTTPSVPAQPSANPAPATTRSGLPVPTLTAVPGPISSDAAGGVVMPFDATISNPYKQPMSLLSTAYAVTSGGIVLSQGREDLRVKNVPPSLAPGKGTSLPITARVSGAQALRALGGNRGGEDAPYVASVYVMIDSPVTGPITYEVTVGEKTHKVTVSPA